MTSEHFALLTETKLNPASNAKSERDHASKALGQLESALSHYRGAGYRVPNGTLWVCAAASNIPRSMALLPVVRHFELPKAHSHGLARAAFAALMPAYVNSRSVDGREFWFDAMANAMASHALGLHVAGNIPKLKRLSNALIAEDWPAPPLFLNLIARVIDPQLDLFRIWTDTTHVMSELDSKTAAEGQSPIVPIELALQQETQKSLLEHYSEFVKERLLAAPGTGPESPDERCPSLTSISANVKGGTIQLDVPGQYTARWACLSLDVPPGKYRNIKLQLAAELPSGLSLQLLRLSTGQLIEPTLSATHGTRIDLVSPETFMIVGVNSNMAQNAIISLRYDDVTLGAAFEPPTSIMVRPGQNVSSNLQLAGIFPELKNLDIEWDFGDGSPKERTTQAAVPGGSIHLERSHAWAKSGAFTLRASVFDTEHSTQEIGFASRQITVQPVQLELSAIETNPQAQSEVRFLVKVTGPLPDTPQFRISFGDGSEPLVSAAREASHRYANAGEYAVSVELSAASAANDVIATKRDRTDRQSSRSLPHRPTRHPPNLSRLPHLRPVPRYNSNATRVGRTHAASDTVGPIGHDLTDKRTCDGQSGRVQFANVSPH